MNHSLSRDDLTFIAVLCKRILLILLVYTLFRWIFYGYNLPLFGKLQASAIFRIIAGGLRFDLSVIAYVNLPVIVLSLLPFSFRRYKGYHYGICILFLLLNSLALLLATADMEYYSFNNRRITLDLFLLVNEVDFTVGEMIRTYGFLILLFLFTVVVLMTSDLRLNGYKKLSRQRNYIFHTGLFLLVMGITVILGRGGIKGKPLSAINASDYASFDKSSLVTNSPFVFLHSLTSKKNPQTNYFPTPDLPAYFTTTRSYDNNLGNRDMNVVFIIWESLSADFIGSLNGYPGYTPFLDSLISQSLVFTHAYANAERSNKGIPAILSSFPSLMNTAYVSSSYQDNCMTGISNYLKKLNYHCSFFHGGNRGTMNFYSYTKRIGFDAYYGREEFGDNNYFDGNWGIYDENFLQFFAGKLNEFPQPFLSAVLTISSHHPFNIPDKYKGRFSTAHSSEIAEAIRYSDYSLGEFFRKVAPYPWFPNTLFIITADHPFKLNEHMLPEYNKSENQFRVPIIFYCPGKIDAERSEKIAQQVDIMPSVLDYIGFDDCFNAYGISLFSDTANVSYQFDNNIYLIQDERMLLFFDGKKTATRYDIKTGVAVTGAESPDEGYSSTSLENKIKAIIQTYNSQLASNGFCLCR
jgi:phosphoglycerol transferase MdoB-like AlkP superfamily enzyme